MRSSIISASPRYAAAWSGVRFSLSCEDNTTQSDNLKHDHSLFSYQHTSFTMRAKSIGFTAADHRKHEIRALRRQTSLVSSVLFFSSVHHVSTPCCITLTSLLPYSTEQSAKWGYKQTSCDCKKPGPVLLTQGRLGVMTPAIPTHRDTEAQRRTMDGTEWSRSCEDVYMKLKTREKRQLGVRGGVKKNQDQVKFMPFNIWGAGVINLLVCPAWKRSARMQPVILTQCVLLLFTSPAVNEGQKTWQRHKDPIRTTKKLTTKTHSKRN